MEAVLTTTAAMVVVATEADTVEGIPAPQPRVRPRSDVDDDYSAGPVTREEDW